MNGKGAKREPDRLVARVAAAQHGVVSRTQLLAAGLTEEEIDVRLRLGRLHWVHQGVYVAGHDRPPQHGVWMAAVLACDQEGRRASLSHRSAAELWGLLSVSRGLIDVTVPGDGGRRRRMGIRIHRSTTLVSEAITHRQGIPVTTPARTIADLRRASHARGGANAEQLRRAIRQANILGLQVDEPLPQGTRSDLEGRFLEICRRHRLSPPEVNTVLEGIEVDFLWRAARVVVEVDSWRYHRGRVAFLKDRERGLELRALGYEVIRISETQIEQEPDVVVSVLTCLKRPG